MIIEIKVTATDVTVEDERLKVFGACFQQNGELHMKESVITEVEDRLIDAIAQRIKYDRDNLIEWTNIPGFIGAKIKIIPAIDYQPQN